MARQPHPAINAALLALAMAVLLPAAACAALPAGVPAVLQTPDEESRRELLAAVRILVGQPVALDAAALTTDNVLLLERGAVRDSSGQRLQGRERGRPVTLELVLDGRRCLLVNRGAGRKVRLAHVRCQRLS